VANHTLTVTNALGCFVVDTVEVLDGTVEVVANIQSPPSEFNCDVTSILLDGASSTPATGTVFTWSDLDGPIPGANSETLLVTEPGTYILTVLDIVSGCTDSEEIIMGSNVEIPMIAINTPEPITCDDEFSLLDGSGSSEGPDFMYQWYDELGNPIAGANRITYETNIPGNYSLQIINSTNGCPNQIAVEVLANLTPPIADAGAPLFLDCATFQVELDGSNSSVGTNINYEWNTENGNILFGLSDTQPIVDSEGTYTIIVTNEDNGCSSEDVVEVSNLDNAPQEILLSVINPTCFGDNDGVVLVDSVIGGTPPYAFSFENSDYTIIDEFVNLPPSTYTISVQDAQGCETEAMLTITEPNLLSLNVGDDETIQLGESIGLNAATNISPSQIDSFIWLNSVTLDCDECFDPIAQPTETTTYEAYISDLNGCVAVDQVTIFVEKTRSVYIPNAFSPDGNGLNEIFTIYTGPGVKNIHEFRVYDRWGENVFAEFDIEPNNFNIGWDGTYKYC